MADKLKRTRRWVLLGAGAAVVGGFAVREYRLIPPVYAGGQLNAEEAHRQALSGDILLVDIRTPREWQATGIGEGAQPLDMRRDDFEQVLAQLLDGDKNAPVALICARGVRSARLSNRLTEAGFTNIFDVPEGMLGSAAGPGWVRSDLPVRRSEDTVMAPARITNVSLVADVEMRCRCPRHARRVRLHGIIPEGRPSN
ncbi:rhodanese-like domain-containing protein [Ruegeria sp.]|uniref:rhodanese-like domain-containing protein n=1 Tax=Ruegeria sp. TaxID=1879320 RepID=UPI003B5B9929